MLPLTVGDHRRELVEVTDQHQLDSAEPFPRAWAKSLQGDGQAVEQVSPDHRGLIDDQSVELLEGLREPTRVVITAADVLRGGALAEGEQAMDGVALDIESRDPRWGRHDHVAISGG